jgi:phosphoribosyl-ATP pyrophosphohydrolase
MGKFTLTDLEKRVHERAKASAVESYTRALIDKGVAHCAKKLGEEAIETGLAAVQEDNSRLTAEATPRTGARGGFTSPHRRSR